MILMLNFAGLLHSLPNFFKSAGYFIAVLSVLVVVHEWGHFIVARLFKMRVEEFSLFFGPRMVRLGVRKGTEYNIRWLPLGGFVKIAGMEPDDRVLGNPICPKSDAIPSPPKLIGLDLNLLEDVEWEKISPDLLQEAAAMISEKHRMVEDAAGILHLMARPDLNQDERRFLTAIRNAEDYRPDPDAFISRPLWQRAAVIFAGPFVSIFFGYLIFSTLGFTTGLPAAESIQNQVQEVVLGSPADKAGIKAGDRIVDINGTAISSKNGDLMVHIIHHSIGVPLHLQLLRGSEHLALTVVPYAAEVPVIAGGKTEQQKVGRLGFVPTPDFTLYRLSPLHSIVQGSVLMERYIKLMATTIFSKQVGKAVGGPIAIASQINTAQEQGSVFVLLIAASLSISLGVVNLLPIPVLDGGHLLLLSWEGIRRRALSTNEMYRAQLVGLSVILVLMALVMANDLQRLFLHKTP